MKRIDLHPQHVFLVAGVLHCASALHTRGGEDDGVDVNGCREHTERSVCHPLCCVSDRLE